MSRQLEQALRMMREIGDGRWAQYLQVHRAIINETRISKKHFQDLLQLDEKQASRLIDSFASLDEHGDIDGFAGVTLKPTSHHVLPHDTKDKDFFVWCALDTVMFPSALGISASIESRCPLTDAPIFLNFFGDTPTADWWISLPADIDLTARRSSFCNQIFFISKDQKSTWLKQHPDSSLVSVEELWPQRLDFLEPFSS